MKTSMARGCYWLAAVFAGALLLVGCADKSIAQKTIYVVFRLDDPSVRTSTALEQGIVGAFRKHGASVTFAVVPSVCEGDIHDPSLQRTLPLSSEKAGFLAGVCADGTVDLAMHGYSHQTVNREVMSEFAGLDYAVQAAKLAEGKRVLEGMTGISVSTFVPPWNSYDSTTLRALEALGFSTISASKTGAVAAGSKLRFLPKTCYLPKLQDAVRAARSSSTAQPLVVVLFHEYDFQESGDRRATLTFQEFDGLLTWVASQPDVCLLSVSQAAARVDDLSVKRFVANQQPGTYFAGLLPQVLREKRSWIIYNDVPASSLSRLGKAIALYGAMLCLGLLLGFSLGLAIDPKSVTILVVISLGSMGVLAMSFVVIFHDPSVLRSGIAAGASMVGAAMGLGACWLYRQKRRVRENAGLALSAHGHPGETSGSGVA